MYMSCSGIFLISSTNLDTCHHRKYGSKAYLLDYLSAGLCINFIFIFTHFLKFVRLYS